MGVDSRADNLPNVDDMGTKAKSADKKTLLGKNSWVRRNLGRLGLGVLTLGGLGAGVYVADQQGIIDIPALHQTKDVPSTFDNNPPMHTIKDNSTGETYYKSDPIIIKAGVNATPATQEDIQAFQNQTPPIFKETPIGEHQPYIGVIFPIDPEGLESLQLIKSTFEDTHGNHDYPYRIADEWQISIKGNGTIPLPLIEGAKKVTARVEVDKRDKSHINAIRLTYQLNDGREIKADLYFESKNYISTDTLKSIPTYFPTSNSADEDLTAVREFDLSQNSYIPLANFSGSASLSLSLGTGQAGGGLSTVFKTKNGELLYSSSTP